MAKALDSLFLKAALLVEGVRATPDALSEVGTAYKEQNHGLFFGLSRTDHEAFPAPRHHRKGEDRLGCG